MAVPIAITDALISFASTSSDHDWNDLISRIREVNKIRGIRTNVKAKAGISVGDAVQFKDRLGVRRVITVTKICPKNIKGVENANGKSTRWTVNPTFIKPVA
jgi:accessory colonization factor AcfC